MELCRISLPIDPATLSPNASKKRRFREILSLKRKAWEAARFAWIAAGKPTAKGRIIYHLIVKRARLMDEDNLVAGLKHVRDGLFVNAITPDDGPQFVKLGHIEQRINPEYRLRPEVIFIVEEL